MISDQTWITLVSASTALIASIAGPFVTLRVGRQQFKASVLSVNRQRWIESLRDALSSHKRLRALMQDANTHLKDETVDADLQNRIDAIVTEIIATSQGILKREWIRVKRGV